jgi:hypothetical protein
MLHVAWNAASMLLVVHATSLMRSTPHQRLRLHSPGACKMSHLNSNSTVKTRIFIIRSTILLNQMKSAFIITECLKCVNVHVNPYGTPAFENQGHTYTLYRIAALQEHQDILRWMGLTNNSG